MPQSSLPLVTVFTLVYNTGKYVVEALESVRANQYPNLQHIIIDDCSTDGASTQIVEEWIRSNKYPCEFIKHAVNQGVCKTLNEVLSLTQGEFTMGVSDDLITPTRIIDHVNLFLTSPDSVAVVYTDCKIINNQRKIVRDSFIEEIGKRNPAHLVGIDIFPELLKGNFIPAMTATVRVSALKEVGGYDESLAYEDFDLWLRLSRKHTFRFVPGFSAYYRIHGENFHTKITTWDKDRLNILLKHIDHPLVRKLLIKHTEVLYELGHTQEMRIAKNALEAYAENLGVMSLFINLRLPFILYRPFKFIHKLVSGTTG